MPRIDRCVSVKDTRDREAILTLDDEAVEVLTHTTPPVNADCT
jgi:hypothetical protein